VDLHPGGGVEPHEVQDLGVVDEIAHGGLVHVLAGRVDQRVLAGVHRDAHVVLSREADERLERVAEPPLPGMRVHGVGGQRHEVGREAKGQQPVVDAIVQDVGGAGEVVLDGLDQSLVGIRRQPERARRRAADAPVPAGVADPHEGPPAARASPSRAR
jgi:hypothetical protein